MDSDPARVGPEDRVLTEHRDLWPLPWDANRALAAAYGLDAADFDRILSAIPVFARKRPDFFAYLRQRLEEWRGRTPPNTKL